jgi:para-aminobenzoate synthetase component II
MKVLLIDNFDSFTYMLKDYIEQAGADCEVLRNDVPLNNIQLKNYQALIISPGPSTPELAGNTLKILNEAMYKMPILGVCLGHQAIGVYFGASLEKGKKPMHGKVSTLQHNDDELFLDIPLNFQATRYHSLVLRNLPKELLDIANSIDDQEVMAIKHEQLPVYGVQFHPESCLSEGGLMMIQNFLGLASMHWQDQ